MAEEKEGETWGHTFRLGEEGVGFLGLGRTVQVIVNGKVVDEATIYGPTLGKMKRHNQAEAYRAGSLYCYGVACDEGKPLEGILTVLQIDNDLVARTNTDLSERFQRPHPST